VKPRYRRILLKLSGEALAGKQGSGIDPAVARQIAGEIKDVHDAGVQIGIVIGGGNLYRGAQGCAEISRTVGDTIGMLATVMNSLALAEFLKAAGVPAQVFTAVFMEKAGKLFSAGAVCDTLDRETIAIIGGGTGNPFFTTDTAAALRAAEIKADVLIKATKVDGVYDSDPLKNPSAKKFDTISYSEALARNLKVMDATAFSFCMENNVPIVVLKLMERGNLRRCAVDGASVGSTISKEG
jgi:uridylate kinase